jgi:hypothetical protein
MAELLAGTPTTAQRRVRQKRPCTGDRNTGAISHESRCRRGRRHPFEGQLSGVILRELLYSSIRLVYDIVGDTGSKMNVTIWLSCWRGRQQRHNEGNANNGHEPGTATTVRSPTRADAGVPAGIHFKIPGVMTPGYN